MHRVSYTPDLAGVAPLSTTRQWHSNIMLKPGHPAVWKNGRLFEEACRWLNDEIVPTRASPNTWAQAAQSLVTWLDFLDATKVDWQHASKADLVAYRDGYLGAISPHTGTEYSAKTVAVRMTYIIDFICFAVENDWIDSDLRGVLSAPSRQFRRVPIDQDALAHIRKGLPKSAQDVGTTVARLNKLKPRAGQDNTVRVISREELAALLRWAGARPSERKPENGGSDRDFVVLAFGWACGLRVQEVADVPVLPILAISASSEVPGQMYKLPITGKGGKSRLIDVPGWLVLDLQAYIEGERKRALKKRGRRIEEKQLILNSEHSTRAGNPMTKPAMQNLMERACLGSGLITKVEKINPETNETLAESTPKYSMHCLRHTYAVMTYHNHRKSGYADVDAWKYLQQEPMERRALGVR